LEKCYFLVESRLEKCYFLVESRLEKCINEVIYETLCNEKLIRMEE